MKSPYSALVAASFFLIFAGCATTPRDPGPPGPLVQEYSGKAAPQRRSAPESELALARVVDSLLPGMSAEAIPDREGPQLTFEQICFRAGRPGAEDERAALCLVICERVGPQTAKPARVWMLRQLERISGKESVPTLTGLLKDEDPVIRDLARRGLQNNPSPEAADALRAALAQADTPEWRVALINALGARHDTASVPMLIEQTHASNETVAAAAVAALGDIGGPEAISALSQLRAAAPPSLRGTVTDAYLRCADRLMAQGNAEQAAALYQTLYDSPNETKTVHIAALRGLAVARGPAAAPLLMVVLTGEDMDLRRIASSVTNEIPGPALTNELKNKLMPGENGPKLPPETQILLIETLAARGDSAALPAVLALVKSENEQVRIAALRAIGPLGDATCVVPLAQAAGGTGGLEADAARISLSQLRDPKVDVTLLTLLEAENAAFAGNAKATNGQRYNPATLSELIRGLAVRKTKGAVPVLFKTAETNDEEDVRTAALAALGALATERDLSALVKLLVAARGKNERKTAEEAVIAVCLTMPDTEKRAAPVVAAMSGPNMTGPLKMSLLRVLGRIGGPSALQALRAARTDGDSEVQDLAIRALAAWPDAAPINDLWEIAKSSTNSTHKVLALRGYIRMAGLPSDRPPAETFKLYQQALEMVTRPEEKKLVLGGLAQVAHSDALVLVVSFLNDESVKTEAAAATVAVARGLYGTHREEALAALEKARAASPDMDEPVKEVLKLGERFEGYSAAWLVAGPYLQDGKNISQLFDIAFVPETLSKDDLAKRGEKNANAAVDPSDIGLGKAVLIADPAASGEVKWRVLRATDAKNPWIFDLAKAIGGEDRCAYVKTMIWSEKPQPARLEIGSDDGTKVWFNGQAVLGKNVTRGLTPGEDKVDVKLEQGWNVLLLKVMQGNGDWRFCCGVRGPDGGKLEGLEFKAE